ncbi:MAG: TonB-dependent receptor [Blastocatellia bacterium]|nr:TonB-dependent receptor [Blastocatellia bacterium]
MKSLVVPAELRLCSSLCGVFLFFILGVSAPVWAFGPGSLAGNIHGKVIDSSGAPIAGATVTLSNPISGFQKQTASDSDGTYSFFNLPYNPYTIRAEASGFTQTSQSLDIRSANTLEITLTLAVGTTSDIVTVSAESESLLETDSASTNVDIDKSLIKRFPAATSLRGMESLILSAPGFMADENGRFHFRGSHGQITYVVDGVQLSDQTTLTYSNSFDPNNVESMEIITGGMMPEFGGRNAAVVNLTTRSALGTGRSFFGDVTLGGARFSTGEIGLQFGGSLSSKFGYFASLGASRSNRFSDPPNFANLHNTGNTQRAFVRFDYAPTQKDFFRLSLSSGRTERDIPNLFSQHAAGQAQDALNKDASVNLSWQHTWSPKVSTDVSPYFRTSAAQLLENSPFSTPISSQQDRHLGNYGIQATVSYDEIAGSVHNHFKAGLNFFAFPVSENFNFAVTSADYNPPSDDAEAYNPNLLPYDLTRGGNRFFFNDRRTGKQYAFFVQDAVTWRGLTLSGGVRYDNYRFVIKEDAFQPRVGLNYYLARTGTVFRASYNRLFFPPFSENLLLASSTQGASLVPPFVVEATGKALEPVKAERQHAYEVGIQQRVKNWFRVDFSYWTKDAKQASDNSQFLNTGINFPVAFAAAKLRGADFRLDVPEHHGFSGYWSIGTAKAVFIPPFTGGLFLDPEVAAVVNEGPFRIDHDQKISSQVGVQYNQRKQGWWVGLQNRYDSGLVTEVEGLDEIAANPDLAFGLQFVDVGSDPQRVKGRSVWNLSAGYEIFRNDVHKIELQAHLLNFTNERGLYNFLSTFGGTHVIPPRTYAVRVKFNF